MALWATRERWKPPPPDLLPPGEEDMWIISSFPPPEVGEDRGEGDLLGNVP
jgi:hypothetical protein